VSVDREALTADFDALDAAVDKLLGHDCEALSWAAPRFPDCGFCVHLCGEL
jgi:hypothetical protein